METGKRLLGLLACALLLGWSGTALASPFTLDAPVAFNSTNINGTVTGTINPVSDISGLTGPCDKAPCPPGDPSPDFVNFDIFVVDITLDGASTDDIDAVGITVQSLAFPQPLGAGAYFDVGDVIPGSAFADQTVDFAGEFTFGAGAFSPGTTSARLWVSYQVGSLFCLSPGSPECTDSFPNTSNFMISHGTNQTVQGSVVLIPEPQTLLLVGGALAAFVAMRQRGRRF